GGDSERGARQALAAARAMGRVLGELNTTLTHDLDEPLRIGIGIHLGPAIVGEMGYGRATSLTAIGATATPASRIEALTKLYGAELVVSATVVERAGVDLGAFALETAEVRGREETLAVRVVPRAGDLPGAPRGGLAPRCRGGAGRRGDARGARRPARGGPAGVTARRMRRALAALALAAA